MGLPTASELQDFAFALIVLYGPVGAGLIVLMLALWMLLPVFALWCAVSLSRIARRLKR